MYGFKNMLTIDIVMHYCVHNEIFNSRVVFAKDNNLIFGVSL